MSGGAKIPALCDFKVHILSITLHWREISGAQFQHNGLWLWAKKAIVMVPDPREIWADEAGRSPFLQKTVIWWRRSHPRLKEPVLCLKTSLKQLFTVPNPCHLSLTLDSQRERVGVWTFSPGNAWGWESWVILGLFTFGIFLNFGPRKTPTCWKLVRVIHCWGFSSSPSAFSSSWTEKKSASD